MHETLLQSCIEWMASAIIALVEVHFGMDYRKSILPTILFRSEELWLQDDDAPGISEMYRKVVLVLHTTGRCSYFCYREKRRT